jgi:hypothetical protein
MFIEATTDLASRVTGAIRDAARATGASFDYLLKTAIRESSLDPNAASSSSSATGLFQFIDQTWLATMKNDGAALGYGQYADSIVQNPSGSYAVADPTQRREIMQLRKDPQTAAAMAGAFTKRNASRLRETLGRPPTDGELYIAHFLGSSGANRLISAAIRSPEISAAALFPEGARANRAIFFNKDGSARSVAHVYNVLVSKHQENSKVQTAAAIQPESAMDPTRMPAARSDGSQNAFRPGANDSGPVFHSLFSSGRREPVSSVVSEMWSPASTRAAQPAAMRSSEVSAAARIPAVRPAAASNRPLDLFQFLRPEIRAAARA